MPDHLPSPDPAAKEQFNLLYCRLSELPRIRPVGAWPEVDRLFDALKCGNDGQADFDTEDRIWVLWCSHHEAEACERMERAIQAIARRDFPAAHETLDEMCGRWGSWAEVWNKRATLLFLEGRDAESLLDIDRTLSLEPRHFGALCGLGQIAIRQGEPHLALAAFDAALKVNPHLSGARAAAESLKRALRNERH